MKKQSAKGKYIAYLDYLFGTIVILRDKGRCLLCARKGNQAHHIFNKKNCANVRHDTRNGVCLCAGCHKFKAHQAPEKYRDTIIAYVDKIHGAYAYEKLKTRAMLKGSTKMGDLKMVELALLQEFKSFKIGYEVNMLLSWETTLNKKIAMLKQIRKMA